MIEVTATGMFDRKPEVRTIERVGKTDLQLCVGSLLWHVDRGGKQVKMWVDIEGVGNAAWELADMPVNMEVTIKGKLERNAWKDKKTGEWQSKHVIKFGEANLAAGNIDSPNVQADEDIPV